MKLPITTLSQVRILQNCVMSAMRWASRARFFCAMSHFLYVSVNPLRTSNSSIDRTASCLDAID